MINLEILNIDFNKMNIICIEKKISIYLLYKKNKK